MNSKSFPSATQSLLNSSNKSPISSFQFNTTHIKFPQIPIRTPNVTTKSSAAAAAANTSYIPAPETEKSPETLYDLLGIPETVTPSEIKQAYRQMALKYHPDVSPPERAEEYTVRFIRVQEAYETLSDPEARSVYDRCMAKGLHLAFSGKRESRVDPRSEDKSRWKETWSVQMSELMRRSKVSVDNSDPVGMSWAARIRKQQGKPSFNGSGQDQ